MGKAKPKKRMSQLSALQKSFAIAGAFPSTNPTEFKAALTGLKARVKQYRAVLGLENIWDAPAVTAQSKSLLKQMSSPDNVMEYSIIVRDITLDEWYKHKVVFTIKQDMIDYLLSEFPFEQLSKHPAELLGRSALQPVLLEFPDNDTVPGVFCGATNIQNEAFYKDSYFKKYPEGPILVTIKTTNDAGPKMMCYPSFSRYQKGFFDYKSIPPEEGNVQDGIAAALIYLEFVRSKRDALGSVLLPSPRKDALCYELCPIPFADSVPPKGSPCGWLSAGLCSEFGYLSRQRFLVDVQNALDGMVDYMNYNFKPDTLDDKQEPVLCRSMMMVTEWERNRTIYQFDKKVSEELTVKYTGPMLEDGIPENLVPYFPQNTIIIYNKGSRTAMLFSTITLNGEPGIFGMKFVDGQACFMLFPCSTAIVQGETQHFDEWAALRHILTVSKTKAIRKQQKDALSTGGDPATTDLVLVPLPPADIKEPPMVRFSDEIASIPPFNLFDLTSRTFSRNRKAERVVRNGWKMPPHVRRSHPHRYWVGHGSDKKMVTKWLAPMQIHAGQVAQTTVIHDLRP